MTPRILLALVFVAGLAAAAGMPPLDLWWLALPALVVPVWGWRHSDSPAKAARVGAAFGLGYFGLGLVWIVEPFLVDVARHGWMAPFALILMAGGLALFWAGAFALARWFGTLAALPLIWGLVELARGWVLTGFPWGLPGYLLAPTPMAQWASVVGSYGLTMAVIALAAVAATGRRGAMAAVLMAAVLWGGGLWLRPPPDATPDRPLVRVVQPNAPQHQKWHPDFVRLFFDRQIAATAADPRPDLVLWPETSLPMFLHQADPAIEIMAEAARGAEVITGVQRWDEDQFFNAAARIDGTGQVAEVYDKHHLVPFGEYMPLRGLFARVGISGLAALQGGFHPGSGPLLMQTSVGRALPLICYEAVFPRDLRGTDRPDLILHLTNDAWFGTWSGPPQHLMQARMRAIEFGLPVVRSANTGISAIIDPAGRIVARVPLGRDGFADAPLPAARPPTVYARMGEWLLLVIGLLGLSLLAMRRRTV